MAYLRVVILFVLMALSSLATAGENHHHHGDIQHGHLILSEIRIKAVMPGAKVTAGYLEITNKGDQDDRLISVSIKGADKSEIHTMSMDGGVMRMRPLKDGIIIPAGEAVSLTPGGLHLMFMKLTDFPKKGDMASLSLVFEKAGAIDVKAPVKMIKPGHGHSGHGNHSGHQH